MVSFRIIMHICVYHHSLTWTVNEKRVVQDVELIIQHTQHVTLHTQHVNN